jgi:hypothetical protein
VPLFVEEVSKAVLESGLLKDAGDRYELTGPLRPLAIRQRFTIPLWPGSIASPRLRR